MKLKVYYEDTDAGGVVYYANYLRFLERARTEFLAGAGISVAEFHRKGFVFTVTHVDISYRRPAALGDVIEINTELKEVKNASLTFGQRVVRDGALIAEAEVTLACVGPGGKPRRLPEELKNLRKS
ncbi:MAG: tol-pal system-associated acyl-CoA thioesterase [Nitrospirota bacterium]